MPLTIWCGHVLGALLLAFTLAWTMPEPAAAQAAGAEYAFNIPGGDAGQALLKLAEQSRYQISFSGDQVRGVTTAPLVGRFTLEQALTRILRGTKLYFQISPGNIVVVSDHPFPAAQGMADPIVPPPSAAANPVAAADRGDIRASVLDEVVVTSARDRNESVQSTPIAVTALDGHLLERAHVADISTIGALVPNLQLIRNLGAGGLVDVYLRGFGANSNDPAVDPHVAVFLNGVYQPSSVGDILDLFDAQQVEVVAGPQGTLAGKNAAVGAVYITSAKPTGDFSGKIQGDYGSYARLGARGYLNFPILRDATGGSILAGRATFVEKEGGNWIYNEANGKRDMGGENDRNGRLTLSFTPTPDFSWDVSAALDRNRDPQPGVQPQNQLSGIPGSSSNARQLGSLPCRLLGGNACVATPYGVTDSVYTTRPRSDAVNVSATMAYHFTPVTLSTTTGYVNYWLDDNREVTGTTYDGINVYNEITRFDQESQELRLASNKDGGWDLNGLVDWVVGGYFSNYAYEHGQVLGVLNFAAPIGVANVREEETGTTQSEAVFAHMIFNFTDQWTGTFGVRQSWDQKEHTFQATASTPILSDTPAGFHNTSFEVGTAYQFDEDRMAYVRFAQGYAAGGFVGFALDNIYQPELNNAYEVGFKSDWLDKRLRVNLDFFLNELSDLQVASAIPIPAAPGILTQTLNAGSATVEGMETQFIAVPTRNLTTHLNLGYLHTKYNQYNSTICSNVVPGLGGTLVFPATDCSGVPFTLAPRWTIGLGGDYARDLPASWPMGGGTATFSADWNYKSTVYPNDPPFPSGRQEGYGLVNLGMTLMDPTETYSIEFYGTNVLDRHYKVQFVSPAAGVTGSIGNAIEDGRPAEWGTRLTYKFGNER